MTPFLEIKKGNKDQTYQEQQLKRLLDRKEQDTDIKKKISCERKERLRDKSREWGKETTICNQ